MNKIRLAAISLVLLVALGAFRPLLPELTAQAAPVINNPLMNIPVRGEVTDHKGNRAGRFTGTLDVTRFSMQNHQLVAHGKLSGTIKDTTGTMITFKDKAVMVPVSIDPVCTILNLVLGPIHLSVLGLIIDVSRITVTITAQTGTLLGDLLCRLAGTTALDEIVRLLNQILAILGG